MKLWPILSSAAAVLLLTGMGGGAPGGAEPVRIAQLIVREQIIIRVPSRLRRTSPQASTVDWQEGKGPKCVAAKMIVGATLLGPNSVDLVFRDNSRMRAKMEKSCPALDYYYGFYITPHADGRICANRDAIRSRVGGECEIERFRALSPVAKD